MSTALWGSSGGHHWDCLDRTMWESRRIEIPEQCLAKVKHLFLLSPLFLTFFSFFNKIQDGRVLESFWCDSDNKNSIFFSASSTKSKMAAKIMRHSLELELPLGFVLCLVQGKNPTLVVWWLVFGVITRRKTYMFLRFWILADIPVLLILLLISNFSNIPVVIQLTCMLLELELLGRFVPRKQLILDICLYILVWFWHQIFVWFTLKNWWQYCISL